MQCLARRVPQPVPLLLAAKVEPAPEIATVVLEDHTYCYEDHLADMGNSPSSDAPVPDGGAAPPVGVDAEQNAIARLQAITGAKAADATRVKPRGPKADAPDYPAIQVR